MDGKIKLRGILSTACLSAVGSVRPWARGEEARKAPSECPRGRRTSHLTGGAAAAASFFLSPPPRCLPPLPTPVQPPPPPLLRLGDRTAARTASGPTRGCGVRGEEGRRRLKGRGEREVRQLRGNLRELTCPPSCLNSRDGARGACAGERLRCGRGRDGTAAGGARAEAEAGARA